ncbi:histidine--tRNA ligase [bacterium]|nr:histidine--tRNA ligase [bacterium]MBU1025527.1 histidine--tRNA ligase [bacterium]
MTDLKAPRGTLDRFPPYSERCEHVIRCFLDACRVHDYRLIHTPTFEDTKLFTRGVGESTDIVMKEMYSFQDKKGRDISLRPEMTAGVVRALIEAGRRYNGQIEKLAYYGPMFRYDRPQKGRYREFFQVGIEAIGDSSPYLDVDVIMLGWDYLLNLGIKPDKMLVIVNSIGDSVDRNLYVQVLKDYLKNYEDDLCGDCKTRLDINTLRVFDCKISRCRELIKEAPSVFDYISDENRKHFDTVLDSLGSFGVNFTLQKDLVRGLDYYTHTVFEVYPTGEEEASQGALLGGGRYDGLFSTLSEGKLDYPAVGFASGVERVALAVNWDDEDADAINRLDVYIIILGDSVKSKAFEISRKLQQWGLSADIDYSGGKLKTQFKRSEVRNARSVMIIGEDELNAGIIKFKPSVDREVELKLSMFDNDQPPAELINF